MFFPLRLSSKLNCRRVIAVADPEVHNGGTIEGRGLGRGLCRLPRKKLNFYLKMVGFGAFLVSK